MNTSPPGITVDLAGNYPVYKQDGNNLISLQSRNPIRRYSLVTDVTTGKTYYLEFTDGEEAQADQQNATWKAGAAVREAEAKQQADDAQRFENALQYKTHIVAFLDILGWKDAILSSEHADVVKTLGKILAQLKGVAGYFNSLSELSPEGKSWPGNPVISQFSDCLVVSVEDNSIGKESLQNILGALLQTLIRSGFLLRGGITRGQLFHDRGLVFGPALIEAYELEKNVAINPRVILSASLSAAWSGKEQSGALPWTPDGDGHLFFNFLPPFMGNPFFHHQQPWQEQLIPTRELLLRKAGDHCSENVFSKYLWLAAYFDRVCDEYPGCGVEKVWELVIRTRLAYGRSTFSSGL